MTTLFISDCHLSPKRPQIIELFCDFLETQAQTAQQLYILGDLFDQWLGDDDPAAGLEVVFAALSKYAQTRVLYFMSGNHDFLVGTEFSRRTCCQFIGGQPSRDTAVVNIEGQGTLLMHGDQLCTDDVAYQRYRTVVRNRTLQRLWQAMPLRWRRFFARRLITASKRAVSEKKETIMDVNIDTVNETMRRYRVRRLIHGHTHRPAVHNFILDNQPAQRFVLGDWYKQGSVLKITENQASLYSFS